MYILFQLSLIRWNLKVYRSWRILVQTNWMHVKGKMQIVHCVCTRYEFYIIIISLFLSIYVRRFFFNCFSSSCCFIRFSNGAHMCCLFCLMHSIYNMNDSETITYTEVFFVFIFSYLKKGAQRYGFSKWLKETVIYCAISTDKILWKSKMKQKKNNKINKYVCE